MRGYAILALVFEADREKNDFGFGGRESRAIAKLVVAKHVGLKQLRRISHGRVHVGNHAAGLFFTLFQNVVVFARGGFEFEKHEVGAVRLHAWTRKMKKCSLR